MGALRDPERGRRVEEYLRFENGVWLLALALLPLLLYRYLVEEQGDRGSIRFSSLESFEGLKPGLWVRLRHAVVVLRLAGLACLILAMARPQAGKEVVDVTAEGIDIMLVLDISGSMEARDLGDANRLEVAKEVVSEFIAGRHSDRIGMVVFAGVSFTQCPLTLDYDVLLEFLAEIEIASRSWDGTAIGVALINACNRLRDADGKSKVVILLTDGVNNAGEIDPMTAAAVAEATGIRVYTIGVGGQSNQAPGRRGRGPEFDEEILKQIAASTGGKYYHATSREKLKQVYGEIGELETTPVTSAIHLDFSERYGRFLWTGSTLLLLGFVLANTRFRRLP